MDSKAEFTKGKASPLVLHPWEGGAAKSPEPRFLS